MLLMIIFFILYLVAVFVAFFILYTRLLVHSQFLVFIIIDYVIIIVLFTVVVIWRWQVILIVICFFIILLIFTHCLWLYPAPIQKWVVSHAVDVDSPYVLSPILLVWRYHILLVIPIGTHVCASQCLIKQNNTPHIDQKTLKLYLVHLLFS